MGEETECFYLLSHMAVHSWEKGHQLLDDQLLWKIKRNWHILPSHVVYRRLCLTRSTD